MYDGVEMRFGSVTIRPKTVLSWSDPGFPTYGAAAPDGVVGYDLLRAVTLLVDLVGRRLIAFDTSAATPSSGQARGTQPVALRVTNGLPVIDVDIFASGGGAPPPARAADTSASRLAVVVDFGAGAALQLSRNASQRLGFPGRLRERRVRQLMGIGGTLELPEGFTDSVRIAGTSIPDAIVTADTTETPSVALAEAEGFVGTEVLRRFAVTLDYAHGRVVFEPNALLRTPFCRNAAGLCVRPDAALTGAEVVFVDPSSTAARAGIRAGYIILSVDGIPVGQLGGADVDRLLERAPGAVLEVVRGPAQLRALMRQDVATSRASVTRRAPARVERVGELIRLPNP
jgi:hypothetical protein